MKKKIILLIGLVVLLGSIFVVWSNQANAPTANLTQPTPDTPTAENIVPGFNNTRFSTTDPASPWVIANKVSALPNGYAPTDLVAAGSGERLRAEAATVLQNLLTAAAANNTPLTVISGYRSYQMQVTTYNSYVKADGQAKADTYSARPGHSEHQTGWAADLGNGTCDLQICFGDSAAGKWLAAHAHEYGFIIRYLQGKETITGYQYEPWHIRYVGVELATELHKTGQTMEEFFGVVPKTQPY